MMATLTLIGLSAAFLVFGQILWQIMARGYRVQVKAREPLPPWEPHPLKPGPSGFERRKKELSAVVNFPVDKSKPLR